MKTMPDIQELIAPYIKQPNDFTCQSACIAQMLGFSSAADVLQIRRELEKMAQPGEQPGSPFLMERYLKSRVKEYKYNGDASLNDAKRDLDQGYKLIIHTYLTNGHVINVMGYEPNPANGSYSFIVDDPWSEFDFPSWSYPLPRTSGNDLRYSAYGIYAAAVAGQSKDDAFRIYKRRELDSNRKGMWMHSIKN